MYCEKCGIELNSDSSFCSNCGTSLANENVNMSVKCCVCGKVLTNSYDCTDFGLETGAVEKICKTCAKHIHNVKKNEYQAEVDAGISYLNGRYDEITNADVRMMVYKLIYSEKRVASLWVTYLRVVAYIILTVLIILGIVLWESMGGGAGFVAFLVLTCLAFLIVSCVMVYLDMASDIAEIKNNIIKGGK